jgi:hypothetical protein
MFETDFIASPTKQSAKSKSIHYRKPKVKDCAKAVPQLKTLRSCGISLRTLRSAFKLRSHPKDKILNRKVRKEIPQRTQRKPG